MRYYMKKFGFEHSFLADLQKVQPEVKSSVNRPGGLSDEKLLNLLVDPQDYTVPVPVPVQDTFVKFYHDKIDYYTEIGEESLHKKEVAYCILAGGAGTAVSGAKALLKIPELDMSLLTLKIFQAVGEGPIWIFTSPALRKQIEEHVSLLTGIDHSRIHYLEQFESYRLTPDNRIIFKDDKPDLYPCGHGDLFPVLARNETYSNFISSGGKYVYVVNVDNVFASLDAAILGHHIDTNSRVSCEVVKRKENEYGGVLVDSAEGVQIAELFRLNELDLAQFTWLSTNSYIFNTDINVSALGKTWHRVKKTINNRIVIQHERLIQEITLAYDTTFIGISRPERFMPIRDLDDLNIVRKIVDLNWKL